MLWRIKNQQFEAWLAQTFSDPTLSNTQREQRLSNVENPSHARSCHPREEHLLPLQVCYELGGGVAETVFHQSVAGFVTIGYQWWQSISSNQLSPDK
jgi:4,5-DOPA dioxygenase extradiol